MSEEYDYRLEDPSVERIDEFVDTKILLAKSKISDAEADSLFNKEKLDVFKGIFKRPKNNEVVVKKITKGLEPYLVVGGRYEIRYLTERTYDIDLLDDAVSTFILGEELVVEKKEEEETEVEIKTEKKKGFFDGLFSSGKKKPTSKPELQIKGIEHVLSESEIMEARNYAGISINPENLEEADFSDMGLPFLDAEGAIVPKDYIDMDKLIAELIEEYATRPEHAQRVLFEKLALTDKKIYFYPVYWAEMIYKEKDTKNVRLDAVSKKIEVPKGKRYAPPMDGSISQTDESPIEDDGTNTCPGCGAEIDDDITFCPDCGVKVT